MNYNQWCNNMNNYGKRIFTIVSPEFFCRAALNRLRGYSTAKANRYIIIWTAAALGKLLLSSFPAKKELYVKHSIRAYSDKIGYDRMIIPADEYLAWKLGTREIDYSTAIEIEDVTIN